MCSVPRDASALGRRCAGREGLKGGDCSRKGGWAVAVLLQKGGVVAGAVEYTFSGKGEDEGMKSRSSAGGVEGEPRDMKRVVAEHRCSARCSLAQSL